MPKTTHDNQSTPYASYQLPEEFPIPENGFDHIEIISYLLTRAKAVLRLTEDYKKHHQGASWAVYGMLEQATRVLDDIE